MGNVFTEVVKGLEWVGEEVVKPFEDTKKIITIVEDVEADAATLLPDAIGVVDGAGELVLAAVKDGGVVVEDVASLVADARAGNIEASIEAFRTLISDTTKASTFADVLGSVSKLTTAYDKFASDGKNALKKLKQDA
jgi:hypothetical protein